jgi:ABC-type sugar transport system substrate-binding protein
MIPKVTGFEFFTACEKGAREATAELGNVELLWDGPSEAKVERQVELIDSFVGKKVDVVAVSANDPDAIAPSLKGAKDAGVIPITWDADADPASSGRMFFVNQATPESVANALMDQMARQAGPKVKYAIVSGTQTAANQNIWMKYMENRRAAKYPEMRQVKVTYPGEDQAAAMKATQDLMKAYPDVTGIFGITSVSCPAAVDAVVGAGKQREIKVVGLATPNATRQWVKNGDIESVILWSPVDLGYLTIHVAKAAREGTLKPGATEFEAGRLGKVKVDGDQVILGEPIIFTKENIDEYDF